MRLMRPTGSEPVNAPDLSGRDRYGRNVAFAWGGYLVDLVAGFIVPRLVSDRLGQEALGIWDFSYSVSAYFALVQLTLGTSVIRYVARYRSVGDWERMNRSASTIARFLRGAGLVAMLATVVTVWWILPLFAGRLGNGLDDAQWVVFFFGIKIGFLVRLATYGAVITGCHRWDLHNSITGVSYTATTTATILIVIFGGGLVQMAFANCAIYVAAEYFRSRLAFRVCPELKIDNRLASWPVFVEQLHYSSKGLIPRVSDLLSNQMFGILMVGFIGPASLALFSRPRRLLMSLRTLAAKAGYILMPSVSSLDAQGNRHELRTTLCSAPAGIAAFALPPIVMLLVGGDWIIRLWMGEAYVVPGLIAVLCAGALPMVIQEPVWSILSGMNAHGRLAFVKLGGAVVSIALLWVVLAHRSSGQLVAAAWCLSIPRIIVDGIVAPVMACRRLQVEIVRFYWKTYVIPLLCVMPLALGGLAWLSGHVMSLEARWLLVVAGCLASAVLYWNFLLPAAIKARLAGWSGRLQHSVS